MLLSAVSALLLLVLSAHAAEIPATASKRGKLQVFSLSKNHISASYGGGAGDSGGVHVTSSCSESGGGLVNITSLDGKEILFCSHSQLASSSLLRVMGHSIVIRRVPTADQQGHTLVDFALPSELSHLFASALNRHHRFPTEFARHLDAESVGEKKSVAFAQLFESPEIQLAAEACHALGSAGVLGHQNPAALKLYSLVARFMHLREKAKNLNSRAYSDSSVNSDSNANSDSNIDLDSNINSDSTSDSHIADSNAASGSTVAGVTPDSNRASDSNAAHSKVTSASKLKDANLNTFSASKPSKTTFDPDTTSNTTFDPNTTSAKSASHHRVRRESGGFPVCPNQRDLFNRSPPWLRPGFNCGAGVRRCPQGPECLGMCGPACSHCWWYLCGPDCCYHRGCHQHDLCCDRVGFFHPSCFFPLFSFSCEAYTCMQ